MAMFWRKKVRAGATRNYSLSLLLRRQNKSNEAFEIMLNSLSLEEVIGLKLELASKAIGGKLYQLPLWKSLIYITRDAVLKYAYSASQTRLEAAQFLGINHLRFTKELFRYDTENYFKDAEQKHLDKQRQNAIIETEKNRGG